MEELVELGPVPHHPQVVLDDLTVLGTVRGQLDLPGIGGRIPGFDFVADSGGEGYINVHRGSHIGMPIQPGFIPSSILPEFILLGSERPILFLAEPFILPRIVIDETFELNGVTIPSPQTIPIENNINVPDDVEPVYPLSRDTENERPELMELIVDGPSNEIPVGEDNSPLPDFIEPNHDGPLPPVPEVMVEVSSSSGFEDTPLPVDLTYTQIGMGSVVVEVLGMPMGSGFNNGVSSGPGAWTLLPTDLPGLMYLPPLNLNGNFDFTVAATLTPLVGPPVTDITMLSFYLWGVADPVDIIAPPIADFEDTTTPLNIAAMLTDSDGSETLDRVEVSGFLTGAMLSAGTSIAPGAWSLLPSELPGLMFTPTPNSNVDFNITVTAYNFENDGDSQNNSVTQMIEVIGVVDPFAINLDAFEIGPEETDITISPIGVTLTDLDGSESLTEVTISNVPLGASFNAGMMTAPGVWTFTPGDLPGLAITHPFGDNSDFNLEVTFRVDEDDGDFVISPPQTLGIVVVGTPDPVAITATTPGGFEDTAIPLTITAMLTDTDGSETLDFVQISNVPVGATFSAGTSISPGVWQFTIAELTALTITPPPDSNVDMNLNVTAFNTDDGIQGSTTVPLLVPVTGVVDPFTLDVDATESGPEHTDIAIDPLGVVLSDTDGSETLLSMVISNVPPGATLSAGMVVAPGVWELMPGDLPGLTITPPLGDNSDFTLNVSATVVENDGDSLTFTPPQDLQIVVNGAPDPIIIGATSPGGDEDTAIPVLISAVLTDMDGSETLDYVQILGVPLGATFNAGVDMGSGVWQFDIIDLLSLSITPPPDSNVDMNLTVRAFSTDDGIQGFSSAPLFVPVTGVVDPFTLDVDAVESGPEHTDIAIDPLGVVLSDTDGSETLLSMVISNVPPGATLSAGMVVAPGVWELMPGDLPGLTITPPLGDNSDFTLNVSATVVENDGDSLSFVPPQDLQIVVNGAPDPIIVGASSPGGDEDTAIPVLISAVLTDTDGSETLDYVQILNVPIGATFNAGVDMGGGVWQFDIIDLLSLSITPPPNSNVDMNLTVRAFSSDDGIQGSSSAPLAISVTGVVDPFTLDLDASESGPEHFPIAIDPIGVILADTDGSETLVNVVISQVPAGALLNAGMLVAPGVWELLPGDLPGLTINPIFGDNSDFTIRVSATVMENDGDTLTFLPPQDLDIIVGGGPDPIIINATSPGGNEDTAIALNITATLTDTDGSETLDYVQILNVPMGASFSAGMNLGGGVWQFDIIDLPGLTITPPPDSNVDMNLTVRAFSTDDGIQGSSSAPLSVSVTGVVDPFTLDLDASESGPEHSHIAIDPIGVILADTDGSETLLSMVISNVPPGATLSAGMVVAPGVWELMPGDLPGLTITPPLGDNSDFTLNVSATVVENDGASLTFTPPQDLQIIVNGAPDPVTINATSPGGNEDTAIALNITATLTDMDGSETLDYVQILAVPMGATFNAGMDMGSGVWQFDTTDLPGLTITPPPNSNVDMNLTVRAFNTDDGIQGSSSAPLSVSVTGVVDPFTLDLDATESGPEHTDIAIDPLGVILTDTDGSETLFSMVLSNLPPGATLSAGMMVAPGVWELVPAELPGLTITPPLGDNSDFTIRVSATVVENDGDSLSFVPPQDLQIVVNGAPDPIIIGAVSPGGDEDTAIPVVISAALTDTDGSETLDYVQILGVPLGATFNAGVDMGSGVWQFDIIDLLGLTITPPSDSNVDMNLTVRAYSTDDGIQGFSSAPLSIAVTGVMDPYTVNIDAFEAGLESTAIAIDPISVNLTDSDGSESLSLVTIASVPLGASFNAGMMVAPGVWEFMPGDLPGLTITPPVGDNSDFTLSVTVRVAENDGDFVDTTLPLDIIVVGIPDPVSVNAITPGGDEDTAIPVIISAVLTDTDGSENLDFVRISNVPVGATFNVGSNLGLGVWQFTIPQLVGLTITPPANSDTDMNLNVTAFNTDDGIQGSTTVPLLVPVTAVADLPTLSVMNVTGSTTANIPLNIIAGLTDMDGSEILSARIDNIPVGASLSAGTNLGGGSWQLTAAEIPGIQYVPGTAGSGIYNLDVSATATETSNSDMATAGPLSQQVTVLEPLFTPLADNVTFSSVGPLFDPATFGDALGGNDTVRLTNTGPTGYDPTADFHGGSGNDNIDAGSADNRIFGDEGNDTLRGRGGNDYLDGGNGDDNLRGDGGNDTIYGGDGVDTIRGNGGQDTLYGGLLGDDIRGGGSADMIFGEEGNDTLFGNNGADTIDGGDGDDLVRGGGGNDTITGGSGSDDLRGENGADEIRAGSDNDIVRGGNGNDDIYGEQGNDDLRGNDGNDSFIYDATIFGNAGSDIVRGGPGDVDLIDLEGLTTGPGGGDWTLLTGDPSVTIGNTLTFIGGDGAGTIGIVATGETITFTQIEVIDWN